jgi:hypothetical protein
MRDVAESVQSQCGQGGDGQGRLRPVFLPRADPLGPGRLGEFPVPAGAASHPFLPERHCPLARHIGLYAYRAGFLKAYPGLERPALEQFESLEQLRALWHGHRIAVVESRVPSPPGVDTPEDLEKVRARFQGMTLGGFPV